MSCPLSKLENFSFFESEEHPDGDTFIAHGVHARAKLLTVF